MSLVVEKTTSGREYKVKDISQADFGRLEIERAETKMPGLMACRTEFGPSQPFKGARINVTLDVTTECAVFIASLTALGAEVRWWPSNSTEDHAAAAVARDSAAVFAWSGSKPEERLVGVSNDTHRYLYWMQKGGNLLCPAFNLNETITKRMFGDLYGCRHSLPDELVRATDVMISGKVCVVCGYGDVGKGCAAALKKAGARVVVTEIDPICALQALMEGFQVLPLEEVVSDADIFVAATGYKDTIMVDQMRKMKNNAIVCSMCRLTQIDMLGLQQFPGVKMIFINTKRITMRYVFPDTKSGIILSNDGLPMNSISTGLSKLPGLVMSCMFTNHTIALLELWNERATGKFEKKEKAINSV